MATITHEELQRMELLEDRVLLLEEVTDKTPSGIHLLADQNWTRRAAVIKTGPGFIDIGMPLTPGDHVYVGKEAGMEIEVDIPNEIEPHEMITTRFLLVRLNGILMIADTDDGQPLSDTSDDLIELDPTLLDN